MQSDEQLRSEPGPQRDGTLGQLVTCRLEELHPHPSYVRHHLRVPPFKLSVLAELGDLAFREPLVIARDRTILDGYARWELARLQGRETLQGIEYELTEPGKLHWLLQSHRRSNGLNDYCRVLLALELEPWLKEKARSNQRAGGQNKGSSNLTEAERLDVRFKIAAAAGVSVGNVSKVKQLTITADPELLEALRGGEIRIHRAWRWSKASPQEQREALRQYRITRLIKRTNRNLILRHRPKDSLVVADLDGLISRLSGLEDSDANPVFLVVLKGRHLGRTVVVSEQLLEGNSDVEGKDNHALPAAP